MMDIAKLKAAAERQQSILAYIASYEPGDIDSDAVDLRFEDENGCDTGCDVSIVAECQNSADLIQELIAALEAAEKRNAELERERAEPVAWMLTDHEFGHSVATKAGFTLNFYRSKGWGVTPLYAEPPAPVVPEGLRIALSNAGIAAPESDEMLWASQQDYIQMLVTWVKDRKPFKPAPPAPVVPMQPLVIDAHGTRRFKKNPIVRKLLDYSTEHGYGLNEMALEQFDAEDRMQLAQLIGYSLSGYGDLSYVTDESYARAAIPGKAEPVSQPYKLPDGWIKCSERMPDEGAEVYIFCDGEWVLEAQYREGDFYDVVRDGRDIFETVSRCVSHWQPRPQRPAAPGKEG